MHWIQQILLLVVSRSSDWNSKLVFELNCAGFTYPLFMQTSFCPARPHPEKERTLNRSGIQRINLQSKRCEDLQVWMDQSNMLPAAIVKTMEQMAAGLFPPKSLNFINTKSSSATVIHTNPPISAHSTWKNTTKKDTIKGRSDCGIAFCNACQSR